MKKSIFVIAMLLSFMTVLVAQDGKPQEKGKQEMRATGRAAQFKSESSSTSKGEQIQMYAPKAESSEKCENCPEDAPAVQNVKKEDSNADCCNEEQPQHRGRHNDRYNKLNLTDDQKQKIETIKANHFKVIEPKTKELAKLEAEKFSAIKDDKIKDAKKIVDKITKVRSDIEKANIDLMSAISKELTAEQKELMFKKHGSK